MSLTNTIPQKFEVLKSSQREDVAALSIVTNKNFTTIVSNFNKLIDSTNEILERLEMIENIQENQKVLFEVPDSLEHESTIEIDQFLMTKYINLSVNTLQFMIVDLNVQRSTNFHKSLLSIFNSENKQILTGYETHTTENTAMLVIPFDVLPTDKTIRLLLT